MCQPCSGGTCAIFNTKGTGRTTKATKEVNDGAAREALFRTFFVAFVVLPVPFVLNPYRINRQHMPPPGGDPGAIRASSRIRLAFGRHPGDIPAAFRECVIGAPAILVGRPPGNLHCNAFAPVSRG